MSEKDSADHESKNASLAYCSICGSQASDEEFALNYPNFVCDECNSKAVNTNGDTPWHGWPPGEEPESEKGVIQMAPDHGENPVFIDGIKCWRRYRFGGHIALRDTFDCESLREFYDAHETDDGFFQVYNSSNPPGVDTDHDRLLVEKVEQDEWRVHVWGMLSAETGEILARNAVAEQVFGPFENFLEQVEERSSGQEDHDRIVRNPTRMLSFFDSFGSQVHKPKVLYLVPELDRPLSGRNAIVETGALRALRKHDVSENVFELGFRQRSQCNALSVDSDEAGQSQMTLSEMGEQNDLENTNDSTITVRYELPYRSDTGDLLEIGMEVTQSILQEIVRATEGTDYRYMTSFPAVDVHAYRTQQEVLTVGVDATTVRDTNWEKVAEQPMKLRELAVTFNELFS